MVARAARWAIRTLDSVIRRAHGVREFSNEPGCILRLAEGKLKRGVTLADGTLIAAGERVGEIHLWNERLPQMPPGGPDLRWAVAMHRSLERSLQVLASEVERDPSLRDIRGFRGETALATHRDGRTSDDLLVHLGLELQPPASPSILTWFTDFWENLYSWWLIWTFNPAGLQSKKFWRLQRRRFWLSRTSLLDKYRTLVQ